MINLVEKLIPKKGFLWRIFSGFFQDLLNALNEEPKRIQDFLKAVVRETNPGTAIDTQEDWYQQYGLLYNPTKSTKEKQAETLGRYIALGGQDIVYLQDQVNKAGFDAVVLVENAPPAGDENNECGVAECGSELRVGAELIINGDMELDDSSWIDHHAPIINERSNTQKHGGIYSRKFTVDAQYEGIKQIFTTQAGIAYNVVCWVYPDDTTTFRIVVRSGDGLINVYEHNYTGLTQDAWNKIEFNYRETIGGDAAEARFLSPTGQASGTWYIDDVSMRSVIGTAAVCWAGGGYGSNWIFYYFVNGTVDNDEEFSRLKTLLQKLAPGHLVPDYSVSSSDNICGPAECGEAICDG